MMDRRPKNCAFIRFEKRDEMHDGKPVYAIVNKRSGAELGVAFYYAPWRQWCARFDEDAVWSQDCLAAVIQFIKGGCNA